VSEEEDEKSSLNCVPSLVPTVGIVAGAGQRRLVSPDRAT
jgi:hypothetical protein